MKTGLIFDLDGTLLDTLEDLTDAANYTLRHFGCPERTKAEIRRFVGNGALRQMTLCLPGRPDDPDPQAVLDFYKPYYSAHCSIKTRPYDGIPEALAVLKEKYPIAIASNKPDQAAKALCDRFFPGIYTRGERTGIPRKPAPDMVYKTMEELGVETCIYIGDSEVDVLTANNAGVPCISVTWGFRDRAEMEAVGGIYFCDKPEDLPALVERICLD